MGKRSRKDGTTFLSSRLVLLSLLASRLAMTTPGILVGMLLIEIGFTFSCPVGVAGQIQTASQVVSVIAALVVGALSIKYRSKSILVVGLLLDTISSFGCYLAPTIGTMMVTYSLSGIGAAMVGPMTLAMVPLYFSLERRGSVIGWLVSGQSIAYVIGAPVIGWLASVGGWRLAFMVYVLPVCLLSLMLVLIVLRSSNHSTKDAGQNVGYVEGFKGVLSNISAISCLIGMSLGAAAYQAILVYSASFFRQRFTVSMSEVSIFVLVGALFFTLGSQVSGYLINRFGRKRMTVSTAFLAGVFIAAYAALPNLWLSLSVRFIAGFLTATMYTALSGLTLEQVPRFRGAMMSIYSAAASLGGALGSGVGGLALLLYGYEFLGFSLGAMMLVAAIVLHLLAVDPIVRETTAPTT